MSTVSSVDTLEAIVGSRPLGAMMKSIDVLDAHCARFLALSSFAVLAYKDAAGKARMATLGGARGFATVVDEKHLRLPLDTSIDPGIGCGLLFFVPGLGETLRVNGRGIATDQTLVLEVEEAFAHCAKAFLRSAFWDTPTSRAKASSPTMQDWLASSPFAVLGSWDAAGHADASPKGDPAGFVRIEGGALVVPDRPGNRRTDTFHNVVEQPRVALLAFVPGDNRVLEVSGSARISSDPALLDGSTVMGKTPKIALVLTPEETRFVSSPALERARLWDPSSRVPPSELPNIADVFIDHVKLNRQKGGAAAALRALASKRVMGWALSHDYEKNRY